VKPHYYMSVIATSGPLMIVRVPWPMPRWRSVLRAMTRVMRSHGGYQRDISALDGLVPQDPVDRDAKDQDFSKRLDAAFAGSFEHVASFWLYDWSDFKGGHFRLARRPKEGSS
jgi:hypothetical protein